MNKQVSDGERDIDAVVRLAQPSDGPALLALLHESDSASHVTSDVGVIDHSLQNNLSESVFVVAVNGRLLGFACVQLTRSFRYRRPTAELTELFVSVSQRGRGLASKLVSAALIYCRKASALELFVRVNQANSAAIRCYLNNGLARAAHDEYRVKYSL